MLAGEPDPELRRADRHRGTRGSAPSVVDLGEVGGQGRGIELPGMRRSDIGEALNGGRIITRRLGQRVDEDRA